MEKAIFETARRRKIQQEYNEKHGIEPQTIMKQVSGGVIETLRGTKAKKGKPSEKKVLNQMSSEAVDKRIAELKHEMKMAAKELRFEDAAAIRDEIKQLNEVRLMF